MKEVEVIRLADQSVNLDLLFFKQKILVSLGYFDVPI